MTEETASEKPEEAAPADKVAPEAGPLVSVTNGPEEEPATNGPEKPTPKVKKGKKSLNGDDVPPVSTRERSSRGAKTKAALQISLSSLKDYDGVQEESKTSVEQNGSAVKRGGRKKKVPITPVCSPIKPSKPGPKCSKLCSKPGPRSLGRYDHEDINLEHRGLDEVPPTAKYDEALKILCDGVDKTKLKVAVPVLDLKAARDPSVQSSFHYAQNHWLTVGQFQGMSNVVTVSYHAPKVTNHHHTKTKNRVIINEAPPKGIRRLQESPPVIAAKGSPKTNIPGVFAHFDTIFFYSSTDISSEENRSRSVQAATHHQLHVSQAGRLDELFREDVPQPLAFERVYVTISKRTSKSHANPDA
jgi:hypothetical protein